MARARGPQRGARGLGARQMMKAALLILALATPTFAEDAMSLTPDWQFEADTVMGGVSTGQVEPRGGRRAGRRRG